jgi:hypothetical protein|tara:strand:- start:628 stop:858 length:231 start_codon:yes stop_codon:yes gene_type:complete
MVTEPVDDMVKTMNQKKRSVWWTLWARSLGEKVGETDRQADTIAGIRTVWWVTHMATCWFIILNAVANHGWGLIGL